jgi:branched-chain amino acid transport system permease protein
MNYPGRRTIIYAAAALALAAVPPYLNAYWVDVLNQVGLYAILGLSLNLIVGHAGLFNLGHAAFYAVGAYAAAILNTRFGVPMLMLLPVSALAAALFAALVARPIIHLRGDYLCIVTIGVGEILRIALVNDVFGITGGVNGIVGIARPRLFGHAIRKPLEFYYLIWGFTAFTVLLFSRLERSRFGRALNYLREDDTAAEGSGVDIARYKLAVFVLGAAWAGMAGNLYAAKMTIIAPESFNFWESVVMFALIILGGSGSIPGVILGAFLIVGLPEIFRDLAGIESFFGMPLPEWLRNVLGQGRMFVFGLAMMVMMVVRTGGILPARPRVYRLPGEDAP